MSPAEALARARDLMEMSPRCIGALARDELGRPVSPYPGPEMTGVVSMCILGALALVCAGDIELDAACRKLLMQAVDGSVPRWADDPDRTQAELVAVFDVAIALAQ